MVPYGSAHGSSGYNPSTGTYARGGTVSNGYGSAKRRSSLQPKDRGIRRRLCKAPMPTGARELDGLRRTAHTAYSQHQTTSQGTTGKCTPSNGGSAYGATGKYGNSGAVGETANGNKYATANGNVYKNTGSGWTEHKRKFEQISR